MLSVLIVDDEYEIREGLRNRFLWEDYNITEILVAEDGDIALHTALEARPDLIITDIKMNRMSGLEFLSALSPVEDYKPEKIIVSGYDDFELVKQAMQSGVCDYILKPINLDELGKMVDKSVETINRRRMDQRNRQMLRNQAVFAIPKMREELLKEMIEHVYDPNLEMRRCHRLQTLELEWMLSEPMFLIVIEADNLKAIENRNPHEKELILFGIGNVVHQTLEEEYPHPSALYKDNHNRWIVVLGSSQLEQTEFAQGMAQLLIQRINEFVKITASAGMLTKPGNTRNLYHMYTEALSVMEQKAVYGGNRLFTEQGLFYDGENEDLSLQEPEEMLDLVRYGTDADISRAMDSFIEMVHSWQLTQLRDIQQKIFEWLFEVFRRGAEGTVLKNWRSNPIAVWELLEQYDTLQALRVQTEAFLHEIAADFRKLSETPSQIVSEAEKILHRDYAESLTLQSVASAVHVTPVWLSKLFKKELHKTFLEYLTEIRVKKAKEMLYDVKFKIYQISYQVGYKDPVHFSKLFKKQVGCTPKEFRRQLGMAEE
ncbi:DNA-binding response regulator [Bacillus sp. FJAT-27264]|uniref:response regulator n=1 Tax=Paenibacillus sp. (strain DSM 101736 / FJAT-27264) TaxID=1850362 RepID=UPI000807BF7F|nr:response regulator [Bacillus sp. FJAT-27264]OBZ19273.1 DNA-binding response regulator [Bacillus sp. FJAT-27264]